VRSTNSREEEQQVFPEKDKTIECLSFQLAQRDAIIKQLEDIVSMQQKLLEKSLVSSEDKPNSGNRGRFSVEGRDLKEVAERKEKREYIMKRRMEMKQMINELNGIM
jgi:hypothetical protein